MRPSGRYRSPPYLLLGLLAVIVVLAFNVWRLTSRNMHLQADVQLIQSHQLQVKRELLNLQEASQAAAHVYREKVLWFRKDLRKCNIERVAKDSSAQNVRDEVSRCQAELAAVAAALHKPGSTQQLESLMTHVAASEKQEPESVTPPNSNTLSNNFNSSSSASCQLILNHVKEEIEEWLKGILDSRTLLQYQERFMKHMLREESKVNFLEERDSIIAGKDEEMRRKISASEKSGNVTEKMYLQSLPQRMENNASNISVQLLSSTSKKTSLSTQGIQQMPLTTVPVTRQASVGAELAFLGRANVSSRSIAVIRKQSKFVGLKSATKN